jgi:hypothetical protein
MSILAFAQTIAASGAIYVVHNGSVTTMSLAQYIALDPRWFGKGYLVAYSAAQAERLARRQRAVTLIPLIEITVRASTWEALHEAIERHGGEIVEIRSVKKRQSEWSAEVVLCGVPVSG